jgi:hypothetical protein
MSGRGRRLPLPPGAAPGQDGLLPGPLCAPQLFGRQRDILVHGAITRKDTRAGVREPSIQLHHARAHEQAQPAPYASATGLSSSESNDASHLLGVILQATARHRLWHFQYPVCYCSIMILPVVMTYEPCTASMCTHMLQWTITTRSLWHSATRCHWTAALKSFLGR